MERSAVHLLRKRGKSLRAIAAELGHSKTTIARALSEPVDQPPPRRQRGCDSVWRAAVRQERLVLEHAQAVADVPIRFEGLPGEYLQVDWGEIRHFPFTQQPEGRRYFLACRLKYSRWVWVRFTTDMRQETLFRGLVDCFNALGFVPWVLVFDNMKTVTIGRDDQEQPIWHRALLQLAAEFDFHPVACWPDSGNQKGSVDNLVKFTKTNFLVGRTFVGVTRGHRNADAKLSGKIEEFRDLGSGMSVEDRCVHVDCEPFRLCGLDRRAHELALEPADFVRSDAGEIFDLHRPRHEVDLIHRADDRRFRAQRLL